MRRGWIPGSCAAARRWRARPRPCPRPPPPPTTPATVSLRLGHRVEPRGVRGAEGDAAKATSRRARGRAACDGRAGRAGRRVQRPDAESRDPRDGAPRGFERDHVVCLIARLIVLGRRQSVHGVHGGASVGETTSAPDAVGDEHLLPSFKRYAATATTARAVSECLRISESSRSTYRAPCGCFTPTVASIKADVSRRSNGSVARRFSETLAARSRRDALASRSRSFSQLAVLAGTAIPRACFGDMARRLGYDAKTVPASVRSVSSPESALSNTW